MRYSKDHKQETRGRLLVLASRLVRKRGVAGLSVATVMGEAKMTVGGFYRHFATQEAMVAESLATAMRDSISRLTEGLDDLTGSEFERALVSRYLGEWHLTHPDTGCPLAAAGTELPRVSPAVRRPLLREARQLVALLTRKLGGGSDALARAWTVLAACVGAMAIARSLGGQEGRVVLGLVQRTLRHGHHVR